MNIIEYRVPGIEDYELAIWQSGACGNLAKIKIMEATVLWDCSGCVNICDYIRPDRNAGVTYGFCRLLSSFRKIIESKLEANEYLIEDSSFSLVPDHLWIDTSSGILKLLPRTEDDGFQNRSFLDRLIALANTLEADKLADSLYEKNKESVMTERDILRFLSSWELELR